MTADVIHLREPPGARHNSEALRTAVADLCALITLDPILGALPAQIHFVLNPQSIARIAASVDPAEQAAARVAGAFALVAYDFPYALHVLETTTRTIIGERGQRIAICNAGLQAEALRQAASAVGVGVRPVPAFNARALKTAFFADTQETVIGLFQLELDRAGRDVDDAHPHSH